MKTELLMIGTELLLGQIKDTNAVFLAQLLAEHGINLFQKGTVGDNPERIKAALDGALTRSDVVLCSGGLGPTEDDITRECIAELLDRPLEYHEEIFETIKQRFSHRNIAITENNKKQAMVPCGATVIPNPNGTAPGLLVEDPRGTIICMPGVPHELEAMMRDSVIPYLRKRFGIEGVLHYKVLKVCAMGESRVDSLMGDLINAYSNPTIGLLASPDATRIRIAARAASIAEAEALIAPVEAAVRERLPEAIMGVNDDTLESVVDRLLQERGWTLAVSETVTGGLLSHRLTAAGAASFLGGEVRTRWEPSGSSGDTVLDKARRILLALNSSCGLAMAPDHEGQRTQVALTSPDGELVWTMGPFGTYGGHQLRAVIAILEQLRRHLKGQQHLTN